MKKYTIIILLSIILGIVVLSQQQGSYKYEPEINQTDIDDSITIAVTYEKLAEDAITIPLPVSEEKVIDLVKYTEDEINQYCLDKQIETRFRFIPTPVIHKGGRPPGENPPGIDEMIQLNQSGINLIVGHDYSLANRYSFEYAKENNMLLLSPTGLAIGQAAITDNLYQLKPNHYETYTSDKVFAQMIKELGYKAFITINTGKHSPYINQVNETAKALNYSYRTTLVELDINSNEYASYLETAEDYLINAVEQYGEEEVCILVEPLWDNYTLFLDEADNHPVLSKVLWFDIAEISEENALEEDYASRLAKYGFIQLITSSAKSKKADVFWRKYTDEIGPLPSPVKRYGEASRYDAMWIMTLSVLETNSSRTEDVMNIIPRVCRNYWGVIGNCTLDENGDRIATDYEIYKWIILEDKVQFIEIGYYWNSVNKDSNIISKGSNLIMYETHTSE